MFSKVGRTTTTRGSAASSRPSGPGAESHTLRPFVTGQRSGGLNRRGFLFLGLSTSACLLMGHTPYRQWHLYRKSPPIFVVSGMDEVSLFLGSTVPPAPAAPAPGSQAKAATTAPRVG